MINTVATDRRRLFLRTEDKIVKRLAAQAQHRNRSRDMFIVAETETETDSTIKEIEVYSKRKPKSPTGMLLQVPLPPIPFMNRDKECEKLAKIFLYNRRQRRRIQQSQIEIEIEIGARSQSQYRLTLATCAQMYGSGKSTFGVSFVPQIREDRFDNILENIRKDEGYSVDDDFCVPSGMQVLVVLRPGLRNFLSEQNIEILEKGEVTMDAIADAITSPSQKY